MLAYQVHHQRLDLKQSEFVNVLLRDERRGISCKVQHRCGNFQRHRYDVFHQSCSFFESFSSRCRKAITPSNLNNQIGFNLLNCYPQLIVNFNLSDNIYYVTFCDWPIRIELIWLKTAKNLRRGYGALIWITRDAQAKRPSCPINALLLTPMLAGSNVSHQRSSFRHMSLRRPWNFHSNIVGCPVL